MSLQLAPEVETAVRQYAEREGVSPDELLLRVFPPLPDPTSVGVLLRQRQREYGLPARPDGETHTSARDLFARWDAEDAGMTPEEAKAEQQFWQELQREREGLTL